MNKHLFRLLFGALFLVAATVFTGCKEDDSKSATPTLSVSTESLVFTDATEKTQTVQITANCEWKVVTSSLDWATVEPMNGRGNGTISVTVQELPAGTNLREGKISFTLIHAEFGNWGTAEQSIAVSQVAGSDVPTGEIAYANNFDKEAATQTYGSGNSWPYTDQFDGWKNESGYGIADVTYTTSGISVRNNSNSNNNYSDYAGSGVNNLLFSSNSNFTIEKIAVNSVNLRLTFGTERYAYGEDDNTFNHDEFKVQLSNDGTNWSAPLTYTFAMGVDPNGRWDLASSDFSLPEGTTSLYVRFKSTLSGAHRLDDVTLLEGAGGQAVTFDYVEPEDPGMDTSDAIYFNDMDKEVASQTDNKWPYADEFDGWKNQTGSGAANVTYTTSGVSVRSNSPSDAGYSDYAGSGNNNLLFGTNGVVTIEKIAVSEKNLALSFGTERYLYGASDNTFNHDEFKVELSNDGTNWSSPLTYTFAKGVDPNGRWDLATADFTLPDGVTTLYIRFSSTLSGAHRLDDVMLSAGNGGQEVSFDGGGEDPDPETTTIGDITTAGNYKTEGTVVARGKMAYIIADNTGAMMVYHKDNERTVGEKISISGEVTIYNAQSTPQFSASATVEVLSSDNKWTYNPTKMDGAAMDALLSASPVCKEIEFEGNLVVDGNYVNVTIPGASTAIGSVKYIDNSTISQLNGKDVVVKGYFVGTSSGKYVNVLPYSIEEAGGSTDPEPDPDMTPIGEITTEGTYKTEGTVVARGKMAYIIADNTGAMMVYHKDNERTVGEKISISGEVTLYNAQSTPQFSASAEVEVLSTGNSWSYNPVQKDGAAMDALLSGTPVCTEIAFQGNLAVSGNYVNVTIPGASTAIGSVKYIDNSTVAAYDGKDVIVKGYFVGTSSGKYVNVLPYSVEEANPSTDPQMTVDPASLSFAAAGGEKSVTVTTRNADGCTIEASSDNAQFEVSVSGTTVKVVAKENTSESKIEGTLTVKLMKAGSAVVTKTVALTQSGVSSGNDTKGTYTSMDIFTCTEDDSPSASYTLGNSTTFNGMEASGVKLGTSSKSGYFTSQAVGVTGSKKLSFYAVAWKGKSATLYVRVNGGGSVTSNGMALTANDGATSNPPFTITVSDSDYYTLDVTGLTASSTITISTSPNFTNESSSAPRAVVAGIQLY
ncbi:BACON domain-containing carbohydrate-binding protein [uncultured Alistipes sp.]|uniref:BACON domain-containing protein n=1 Tax=uncultured Alistipes sp. TaxID=538949 RepID=UPI002666F31F|nr:BACON domain-containing carbohydrate-binding protein [uncultured Alistipes sp.]